jgi:hypothetical protein
MPTVHELAVAAVRSAMAPGYQRELVGAELVRKAHRNITALRIARARVERGAGWRSGPIGLRAREALTCAIELAARDEIDLTETADSDATDTPVGA